ncbi:MAG: metal ABC transporter substrate-binding protein [Chloroflexota bacterium]|nr:metal ABC transporter substrate-binding protein [Chloroflexota bacterium]
MAQPRLARLALSLVVLAMAGCQSAPTSTSGSIRVVTTTTVFADMIASVGGDLVEVTSLVPKNGDVHTFEPKPADIRAVAQADLLVMNGLGLDDWLEKTIANASQEGTPLVKLGVDLPGVVLLPGDEPGTQNPHLWLDVKYAELYLDRIVAALQAADKGHAEQYQQQGAAYRDRLDELNRWVRDQIASIPEPNRKIVTFHDAFPYYAREYGITIVGVAVQAPGQDPSAGDTAALVEAIRAAGVKAIFSEAQFPAKLVEQLAAETGTRVVADLYDDSVGDPPVTTYEAVVRWDTQQLVDALK